MLKLYKFNGAVWRYEEGKQPAGAVPVEVSAKGETPESRASKAKAAKAKAGAKKAE